MVFLISLIGAVAFACIFKTPLKKAPWAFYAGALVLVVLYVGRETFTFPVMVERPIFYLMQKCTFAEALFVVVMYIGVLGETSRIRAYLMPVRAELSIVACIIAFGHIIGYLMSFLPQVIGATASLRATILFSFCLALLLVLLLVVLGATSFNAVKRAMSLALWKRIQWLAYPFFLLTYVHLLLFLLPAALHGATPAQFSVVVYTVVFGGYLIARSVRMIQTRRTPHRAGRS